MANSENVTQALGPVLPSGRILTLDVLRGFALLGILVVNMELFVHPIQRMVLPLDPETGTADRIVDWLVRFLFEGKFYSLFSLLFGLGFGLQLLRAEERGRSVVPVYLRRLFVLLAIGVLHAVLIWMGDILTAYALFGFLLLLFRRAKPRTLLIWAAVCIAIPIGLNALGTGAVALGRLAGPEISAQIDRSFAVQDSTVRADLAEGYRVYANGGFGAITRKRIDDFAFASFGLLIMGPNIIAMFLLGLYAARRKVFADIGGNRRLFTRVFRWALPIGLVCNALYATLMQPASRMEPSPTVLVAMIVYGIGAPALSLAYASGITLLVQSERWRDILKPLAAPGRIPLSNYLSQSIICTMIFYGYGLALFGRLGRGSGVVLAICIYALLLVLSGWWVKRFQFGPAEWLWRALTYLAKPPMKIT